MHVRFACGCLVQVTGDPGSLDREQVKCPTHGVTRIASVKAGRPVFRGAVLRGPRAPQGVEPEKPAALRVVTD